MTPNQYLDTLSTRARSYGNTKKGEQDCIFTRLGHKSS